MKFVKYAFVAALTLGTLLLGSCHGQTDTPEPDDPSTVVPEGVLRIFANKTQITADGSDEVVFKVMFGSEDVSTARTLQLVRISDGGETLMNYGVNTFSTTIPTTYTFKAEFYRSGRYYSDNEVQVVAVSSVAGGDTQQWAQKILGFQFTSVGCSYCPELSKSLKLIKEGFPERMAVASFHQDFGGYSDAMSHPMTASYYKLLGRQGLPQFNANLIMDDEYIIVSEYDKILAALDGVEQNYPATCGVAVESGEVAGGDHSVKVKVRVTSNTASQYRYQIFVVEDGIVDMQMGVSGAEATQYVHNNVVRAVGFDSVYGYPLNDGVKLQVGVESVSEHTLSLPSGIKSENARVIVAVLATYDGGNSYVVNNCAECPLNGSVDYAIVQE